MGWMLSWFFLAAAGLCWFAAALVAPAFVQQRWVRILLRCVAAAVPVLGLSAYVIAALIFYLHEGTIPGSALTGPICMAIFVLAGIVVLLFQRWWRWTKRPTNTGTIRIKLALMIGFMGLLCVGLHVFALAVGRSAAQGALDQRLQALREKLAPQFAAPGPLPVHLDGSPIDADSAYVALNPDVPGGKPTAWDILGDRVNQLNFQLLSEGQPFDSCRVKLLDVHTGTPEDDRLESLDETMPRFATQVEQLRAVTRMEPYLARFTLERFEAGEDGKSGMELQGKCQLLEMDAISATRRGQFAWAIEDLNAMDRLAGHAVEKRHLIGLLIAIAIRSIKCRAVEAVLAAPGLRASDLDALEIQRGKSCQQWFAASMDAQELLVMKHLAEYVSGNENKLLPFYGMKIPNLPNNWYLQALLVTGSADGWVEENAQAFAGMRENAKQPWLEQQKAEELTAAGAGRPRDFGLLSMFSSVRGHAVAADTYTLLIQVACAAFRYKESHGHYPADCRALVGDGLTALPIDPFDGKPLKMKSLDGGLVIYSIGSDGIDNGGDQPPSEYSWEQEDQAIYLGPAYVARRAAYEKTTAARRAREAAEH